MLELVNEINAEKISLVRPLLHNDNISFKVKIREETNLSLKEEAIFTQGSQPCSRRLVMMLFQSRESLKLAFLLRVVNC